MRLGCKYKSEQPFSIYQSGINMSNRTVTIPQKTITQGINNVNHYLGDSISFYVGIMQTNINNELEFIVPQTFDTITISGDAYRSFIADHPNGFIPDDLWQFVN